MAGANNRGGSTRAGGGTVAARKAPARALTAGMVKRGMRTMNMAGNQLDNVHQDRATARSLNRLPYGERRQKLDRMRARLVSRTTALRSAERTLARNDAAQTLRQLRKADPKAARQLARLRREARRAG